MKKDNETVTDQKFIAEIAKVAFFIPPSEVIDLLKRLRERAGPKLRLHYHDGEIPAELAHALIEVTLFHFDSLIMRVEVLADAVSNGDITQGHYIKSFIAFNEDFRQRLRDAQFEAIEDFKINRVLNRART